MMHTRHEFKELGLTIPYAFRDAKQNRRYATASRRFLVVRHAGKQPYRHQYLWDWIAREFPKIRSRFELRLLRSRVKDLSPYILHIPLLQDPVEDWSPCGYRRARNLARRCEEANIPVINRVDCLANCVKSVGARIMRSCGVRTPRITPIGNIPKFWETLGDLELPLLIREDRGHGKPSFLIRRRQELSKVTWDVYEHPIAVEFVDVAGDDGLYRKYRYLATGDRGVARHCLVGDQWEMRMHGRICTKSAREEELAYLDSPDPNHVVLQKVRRSLGLDLVAFDYSYDREGRMVVWEANPYPGLEYPKRSDLSFLAPYVERSLAAVLRLFLEKARLPVPSKLADMLAGQDQTDSPIEDRLVA